MKFDTRMDNAVTGTIRVIKIRVTSTSAGVVDHELDQQSTVTIAGVARNGEGALVSTNGLTQTFSLLYLENIVYAGTSPVVVSQRAASPLSVDPPFDRPGEGQVMPDINVAVGTGSTLTINGMARTLAGAPAFPNTLRTTYTFPDVTAIRMLASGVLI